VVAKFSTASRQVARAMEYAKMLIARDRITIHVAYTRIVQVLRLLSKISSSDYIEKDVKYFQPLGGARNDI
jgi:hypothetical protein